MTIPRRHFLTLAGATTATVLVAPTLYNFFTIAKGQSINSQGFGQLISDPQGIIDLPEGFQYQILSQVGHKMSDGTLVPTYHDGMAAFSGKNGTTILIRNHELSPGQMPAVIAPDEKKYDKLSNGGTTTLIIDKERQLIKEFVSLAGTNRNCAGGSTPWNTWISSEEDTSTPINNNVSLPHGYNFEVSLDEVIATPIPLVAMGRFRHEAIVVDPQTGYIYQTEDQSDSCFYRFRPHQPANLSAGGILEALVIEGMPKLDTSIDFPLNTPQKVSWVKLEDINPHNDTLRYEAQAKGAAIFRRGEGMCLGEGQIYWTCTNGGKAGRGQIFRHNPINETIELFVESPGAEVLDYPDNIIMTPFGDLMACEDGAGEQFLVGITPQGKYYHFAHNALNNSEFAGVCFSPDGQTMFVNIYSPGLTLAIWGSWQK